MPPISIDDLSPTELQVYNSLSPGQKPIYLDLSPEVRRIIGLRAPANACHQEQADSGVCIPDPRVTSQVGVRTPIDWDALPASRKFEDRVLQWRIKGARTGDLLLSPGGPSGMIGAMLAALTPAQDYSHMGIVVKDDGENAVLLRHCTASEDWLNSRMFATGTVFAGTPLEQDVPLLGFRPDAIRFIWPGTITQSVEVAYKSYRDTLYATEVYETDAQGKLLWEPDEFGRPQKLLRAKYAVSDADNETSHRGTGKRFRVSALTFDPVEIAEAREIPAHLAYPLVVQPCISKRSAAVRSALSRVAAAAEHLRGHYRLFAYTDGAIGDAVDGPSTLEGQSEPYCRSGHFVSDPVTATRGLVCSTMIWQAVQQANADGGARILVDGRPSRHEPTHFEEDRCLQLASRNGRARRFPRSAQRSPQATDGLYFYTQDNRSQAANALQKELVGAVMTNIQGIMDDISGPPLLGAAQGAGVSLPISALLGWNPVFLAFLLGTTKAYVDTEVEKIRMTAKHLSNQLGDTFRADNAVLGNQSEDWLENPRTGHTVSPDDILNSWAAPFRESDQEVVGLYGSSIRAEVLSPGLVDGPWRPSTWEISAATADFAARVLRRDVDGAPVYLADAVVRVGCAEHVTRALDDISDYQDLGTLPYGRYFAFASWIDPDSGLQWRSPRQIVDVPDGSSRIDIEVYPPKESRRYVRIHGSAELINRHVTDEIPVFGTSAWTAAPKINSGQFPMSMDFSDIDPDADPEFFAWLQAEHGGDLKGLSQSDWLLDLRIEDWGIVRVVFTSKLDTTGMIVVSIRAGTRKGVDPSDPTEPDWAESMEFQVPPDSASPGGGTPVTFSVERSGFAVPPVRAHFKLTINNIQQSG